MANEAGFGSGLIDPLWDSPECVLLALPSPPPEGRGSPVSVPHCCGGLESGEGAALERQRQHRVVLSGEGAASERQRQHMVVLSGEGAALERQRQHRVVLSGEGAASERQR